MPKFGHAEPKFEKRKLLENSRFPHFKILGRFGLFHNFWGSLCLVSFWSFWVVSALFGWLLGSFGLFWVLIITLPKFQSHPQQQDALDVSLFKACATLAFRLNFRVIISCSTHWTSAC